MRVWTWPVLLAGCGNLEVAQLEARQEELAGRFDTLQQTVRDMRKEMVDVGLISPTAEGEDPFKAARSKAQRTGRAKVLVQDNQLPGNELAGEWAARIARTGTPSALPPLGDMERDDEFACGWKFTVPALKGISNVALAKNEAVGKASPIELWMDDTSLTPHALNPHLEACAGRFRHAGNVLQFSPDGSPDAAEGRTYSLRLAEPVPLPRAGDGRPMYWIYPGTRLTVDLPAWKDAWGALSVDLGMHVAGEGALLVTVAGEPTELGGAGEVLHSVQPDLQSGPWSISIGSPKGGPFAVLEFLTVGNSENALVVTGERAFKAGGR
jgi:hypothetical protein